MRIKGKAGISVLWLSTCIGALTVVRPASADDGDAARAILSEMLAARKKITNVRCKADCVTWRSQRTQEAHYQHTLQRGISEEEAAKQKRDFVLDRYDFVFDSQGRFRVAESQGACDPNGKLLATDGTTTHAWNGAVSMELSEGTTKTGNIGTQMPLRVTLDNFEPGAAFGGVFCRILERVLSRKDEVQVRTQAGKYHVEIITQEGKARRIAVIDPLHGYTVCHYEYAVDGDRLVTWDAKFREVSPGIWYPIEGTVYTGAPDDPATSRFVRVTDVIVNDPNLNDTAFQIDFPEGARVFDTRTGLNYVVGDPLSQRVSGDSTSRSLREIAQEAMEEGLLAAEQGTAELSVPKAQLALQRKAPFVLDLLSHELVNPGAQPRSKQAREYLVNVGKGDLAWDGRFVATRGARVLTAKKESSRPMKTFKGAWAETHELPRSIQLPYWMTIITKERIGYLLCVHSIEKAGVRVTYRRLTSDETKLYLESLPQTP